MSSLSQTQKRLLFLNDTESDDNDDNDNFNATGGEQFKAIDGGLFTLWQSVVLGILAGCTSLITVGGNLTVLLSFFLERSIRQPSNYFIASLAVSDLLIGTVSMPLYTIYVLTSKNWPLGEMLCDLWLSVDYTACLCSIYTVFCITVDRFFSIRLPTKYRVWRTERRILAIVFMTWAVPVVLFFTSIFGWQYFVGRRTVPDGKCFVQYMEDAFFNCFLQVGYFWITLVAMVALYVAIYRVALDLQRRSEEKKRRQLSSLATMAGCTIGHLGTVIGGMSRSPRHGPSTPPPSFVRSGAINIERVRHPDQIGSKCNNVKFCSDAIMIKGKENEGRSMILSFPQKTTSPTKDNNNANANSPDGCVKRLTEESSHLKNRLVLQDDANSVFGSCGDDLSFVRETQTTETTGDYVDMIKKESSETIYFVQLNSNEKKNYYQEFDKKYRRRSPLFCDKDEERNERFIYNDNSPSTLPRCRRMMWKKEHHSSRFLISRRCASLSLSKRGIDYQTNNYTLSEDPYKVKRTKIEEGRISATRHHVAVGGRGLMQSVSLLDLDTCKQNCSFVPATYRFESDRFLERGCSHQQQSTSSTWNSRQDELWTWNQSNSYRRWNLDGPFEFVSNGKSDETETTSSQHETRDDCNSLVVEIYEKDRRHQTTVKNESEENSDPATLIQSKSSFLTDSYNRFIPHYSSESRYRSAGPLGRQRATTTTTNEASMRNKNENRARKALRTITIILGAFVLCWTPWHILSLIIGFCHDSIVCVSAALYDISYWLCYLNSPINPFCYAFVNQQFKKTFLRILKFKWHKT